MTEISIYEEFDDQLRIESHDKSGAPYGVIFIGARAEERAMQYVNNLDENGMLALTGATDDETRPG